MAGAHFLLGRSKQMTKQQFKARAKRRASARLNQRQLRETRRRLSGSANRLAVYDGTTVVGFLEQADDGRFQTYGADGFPAGVFDNFKDATASLPKAEAVS
jgi:hypothetical protein